MNAGVPQDPCEVIIVGAGATGLFLACRLRQLGISVRVYESRTAPATHSRSIGLHPPSLELLHQLEMSPAFIARGLKVERGAAYAHQKRLGELRFERCPGPFKFVLTLPQSNTESLLAQQLTSETPDGLHRGCRIVGFKEQAAQVTVSVQRPDGGLGSDQASFLIGCDGLNSTVRDRLDIEFPGHIYPGTYGMGDFDDQTAWGPEARIFLSPDGFAEAFPLPGSRRRWVISQTRGAADAETPDLEAFCQTLHRYTGHDLRATPNHMLSGFQARRHLAEVFYRGRVVLAGDAAHVMSPFGGQGMNIGWLNAWDLARALQRILRLGQKADDTLRTFDLQARHRANRAIYRAERNMRFGQWTSMPRLRSVLVHFALHSPLRAPLARIFTLRGL